MKKLCSLSAALLPVCLLVIAGCGPKGPEGLVPAYGTVTLDGQPLADAQIVFRHETRGESVGRTDDRGYYEMYYTYTKKGAFTGPNFVSFTTSVVYNDDEMSDDELIEDEDGNLGSKAEKVPSKYRHEQSELTVDVSSGGAPYDIDLTTGGD